MGLNPDAGEEIFLFKGMFMIILLKHLYVEKVCIVKLIESLACISD